jgi:transcriptional regulator with XRE-family HTH domain
MTTAPLNWQALVDEALRRRKAEKLTQREHAALAGVSIPTIVGFDRGERTLSLAKAFDILQVVGLLEEPTAATAQDRFVAEAMARWEALTAKLPADSPARFPHGWYRIDYCLEGELRKLSVAELRSALESAKLPNTGWPMFRLPSMSGHQASEIDGILECWMKPQADRPFTDAANSDFWRASPAGRLVLVRGHREDAEEAVSPGTILDVTLPVWRITEALRHAARLARELKGTATEGISVHFNVHYTGLGGRMVRSLQGYDVGQATTIKANDASVHVILPLRQINEGLVDTVLMLVASLHKQCGIQVQSRNQVDAEVNRFLQSGTKT